MKSKEYEQISVKQKEETKGDYKYKKAREKFMKKKLKN